VIVGRGYPIRIQVDAAGFEVDMSWFDEV